MHAVLLLIHGPWVQVDVLAHQADRDGIDFSVSGETSVLPPFSVEAL